MRMSTAGIAPLTRRGLRLNRALLFSLLVHGDVPNSLRANWVGTIMAIWWMTLIPWGLGSAIRGRLLFIRNGELWMTVALTIVLTLMCGRWAVIFFG